MLGKIDVPNMRRGRKGDGCKAWGLLGRARPARACRSACCASAATDPLSEAGAMPERAALENSSSAPARMGSMQWVTSETHASTNSVHREQCESKLEIMVGSDSACVLVIVETTPTRKKVSSTRRGCRALLLGTLHS